MASTSRKAAFTARNLLHPSSHRSAHPRRELSKMGMRSEGTQRSDSPLPEDRRRGTLQLRRAYIPPTRQNSDIALRWARAQTPHRWWMGRIRRGCQRIAAERPSRVGSPRDCDTGRTARVNAETPAQLASSPSPWNSSAAARPLLRASHVPHVDHVDEQLERSDPKGPAPYWVRSSPSWPPFTPACCSSR